MTYLKRFWREDSGQDMVEYALLLAFLCLAGVGLYQTIAADLKTIWTETDKITSDAALKATGQ